MSVAIVALTENRTVVNEDGSITNNGPLFDWSTQQQGFALGAFFYGYIFTQVTAKKFKFKIFFYLRSDSRRTLSK
jgi:hypothetical protein